MAAPTYMPDTGESPDVSLLLTDTTPAVLSRPSVGQLWPRGDRS